jgi:hypothetical protein
MATDLKFSHDALSVVSGWVHPALEEREEEEEQQQPPELGSRGTGQRHARMGLGAKVPKPPASEGVSPMALP